MTNLREAAKAVLDCWDSPKWGVAPPDLTGDLMEPLRAALEQQAEPVAAESITDAMMNLVDRLGSEWKQVDLRAWQHLLVYAPQQPAEPVAWMDRDGDLYSMPVIENWSPPHTLLYTTPPQSKPPTCEWSSEDDDTMPGTYRSACGELWSFIDGGWKDNHVRFCQGCGGKVVDGANGIGEKP